MKFSDFKFNASVNSAIEAMGYETPTPVQEKSIPPIVDGSDVIACAQTGTGKTAAFILPIIDRLVNLPKNLNFTSTLVIVPTRELALQIDQQLEGFSYFSPLSTIAVYGGSDGGGWDAQRLAIQRGVDFIVATPGRLIQHLRMGYMDLSKIDHLVLDEADRMLDMGFYDDIMDIVSHLPKKRQTLMFSATMPHNIRKLAKSIMANPVEINIAISKPAENVLQAVYYVEDKDKINLLSHLLSEDHKVNSAIIFSSTRVNVRKIEKQLKDKNLSVNAIHSDLDQKQREEVLRQFRSGSFKILVATDIISRGIDIEDIDLIVNFDVPNDPEDYVHRIGRTARAQSDGVALTFVNKKEKPQFKRIEDFLGNRIFSIPVP